MSDQTSLEPLLRSLPQEPGVYLMKNLAGEIIYIGKATSIKKRVTSYFHRAERDPKTAALVRAIAHIDYIITDNEMEALILESSLVKKHLPRYNVRLKDDKRYPSIVVTLDEEYPRVLVTRDLTRQGGRYFGPYTDVRAARRMVATINAIFKLKTCTKILPLKSNERPCLNFQMKRCQGVCTGEMTRQEYLRLIDAAVQFLAGSIDPVIKDLQQAMKFHSEKMEFEKAGRIRDIIYDIQRLSLSQKVFTSRHGDHDYISLAIQENEAILLLFEFRNGIMMGSKISVFDIAAISEKADILRSFMISYYGSNEAPPRIMTEDAVPDKTVLEEFLGGAWSKRVRFALPETGEEKSVFSMMRKNLASIIATRGTVGEDEATRAGITELQAVLSMHRPPQTIECFDISHFQGSEAVASMVFFRDGRPEKGQYRRYRIRGYEGIDDPGMIHEVVSRRLQYLINEEMELPDLMIIDGGIPQLGRAREAASALGAGVLIISIAKRFEEIYRGNEDDPLRLPETSPALKLIQRARDEAHRFAVTYHRSLRGKKQTRSALEDIPGVGEKVKVLLLKHLGSPEAVKSATLEELMAIPGIGEKMAARVQEYFHRNK